MAQENRLAHHVVVDVNDAWVNSMKHKLEASCIDLPFQERCTIFRVPPSIRQGDPTAFDPQIISIGPYHHDKRGLKAMDKYKWCYLRDLLARIPSISFEDCLKGIKAMEAKARGCYSDEFELKSDKFAEMLLLDACFMIEIFKRHQEEVKEDDPIRTMPWIMPLVKQDLLLVENQLPFFVLQHLFDLIFHDTSPSLTDLAIDFYSYLFITKKFGNPLAEVNSVYHLHHLLHIQLSPSYEFLKPSSPISHSYFSFRHSYVHLRPLEISSRIIPPSPRSIPSATELQVAGVKFKKNEAATSFLHVKFHNGIMEISPLFIDYSTNSLMRNFIAFEQCNPRCECCFTSYAILMDSIINTPSDVAILGQYKIVEHGLGSDEDVALLFNSLGKGVGINVAHTYLPSLFQEVNKYCDDAWHTWRANLVRNYFSSPWSAISFAAGIAAFLFSAVMTFFVIYSYYHPYEKLSSPSGLALFPSS